MTEIIESKDKNKQSLFDDLVELVETVIFSVFIVTLIFTFLIRIAAVDGDSMNDTLTDGDRLIITHLFYTPQQGDIVIVNNEYGYSYDENEQNVIIKPGIDKYYNENYLEKQTFYAGEEQELSQYLDGSSKRLVKRIIAVAGQEINFDFIKGKVFVDGVELDEPYIKDLTYKNSSVNAFDYPIVVPDGYVFVMGDNRNESRDSRNDSVGFIPVDQIMGKVILRIYPFEAFGIVK